MPELIALTCPNCGGSVAPPAEASVARCAYCGHVFEVMDANPATGSAVLVDQSAPAIAPSDGGLAIRISRGGAPARQETFTADIVQIGSGPKCTLRLDGDPAVGRIHAVIEIDDGVVTLRDLGSFAGTFVNGMKIDNVRLHSGDVITVGKTRLAVAFA